MVLEANFRPPTPPEVNNHPEVADGTEAIDEARDAMVLVETEIAGRVSPVTEVPEVAGALVTNAAIVAAKPKARKEKRSRGDCSGGSRKEKRSRSEAPIYKDKIASANLVVSCLGPPLTALEALLEARSYRETAAGFLKVFILP